MIHVPLTSVPDNRGSDFTPTPTHTKCSLLNSLCWEHPRIFYSYVAIHWLLQPWFSFHTALLSRTAILTLSSVCQMKTDYKFHSKSNKRQTVGQEKMQYSPNIKSLSKAWNGFWIYQERIMSSRIKTTMLDSWLWCSNQIIVKPSSSCHHKHYMDLPCSTLSNVVRKSLHAWGEIYMWY